MRDYGKVYTAFWQSEDMRSLSEDGRMLVLYLMTCPHGNMLGCFRLSDAYAGEDLQWEIERVRKGFDELFAKGFSYRCERSFWVFIRYYLKWNHFENPNVATKAFKLLDSLRIPNMHKGLLINALREFGKHFDQNKLEPIESSIEPFDNPFDTSSKTIAVSIATTKPEPETKTSVDLTADVPAKDDKGEKKNAIIERIFAYWQEVMNSHRSSLDKDRRTAIEKALKNYRPEDICDAIRGCAMTPHNMGENEQKTKYNAITLILRNADNIDRFINKARSNPNGKPIGEPQSEAEYLAGVQAALDQMNGHSVGMADDENIIDMEQ